MPWARMIVRGRRGNKTLFSWTWKLHRKKPHADAERVNGRRCFLGLKKRIRQGGVMAVSVARRDRRWRVGVAKMLRNLMMGLRAHQRLATLSSQSPREKGKHLWRAWAKIGREFVTPFDKMRGSKRSRNVDRVAIAIAVSLRMFILGKTQRPRRYANTAGE